MGPILLTLKRADLSDLGPSFSVVANGFESPIGVNEVPLETVLNEPERWLDGSRTMVVVGLSHLMTPSNRVRLGRIFLRPRPGLRRICVDRQLFTIDPWRMWWLFRSVGHDSSWGLTDSFLAETRWKASLEMQTPDPFRWDVVRSAMRGVVCVRDAFRFPTITWQTISVGDSVQHEYLRKKEEAFSQEKTLAAILGRLATFVQKAVPNRHIPTMASLFKKPPSTIVRTNLGVDTFLSGEIHARVYLTNAIANWDGT